MHLKRLAREKLLHLRVQSRNDIGVFAFLLGGIVAAGLMVWRGYSCTSKIPFGPFLVFGGCFSYWCGMECWQWYERLL